jgi:tRNA(Ile)-lysidine synthase
VPELRLPDAALRRALSETFALRPRPDRLGVAVSGGGDSVALLHLLAGWQAEGGPPLAVVTVDHGLRPEAAAEAALVARQAAALGLSHDTLVWQGAAGPGWDGQGNLMDAARRARLGLIAAWARARAIPVVALGHTADDQAETVLMRLARGSGVDGLAGMARWRHAEAVDWVRPLLGVARADLRAWLAARGIGWAEDPTNADPAYDRVKARAALRRLAPLGLTRARLVDTATRMAEARAVLEAAALAAARSGARIEAGEVILSRAMLRSAPRETQLRLLAHAIRWITAADYRPRIAPLAAALEAALDGGRRRTLAGCLIGPAPDGLRVGREPRAACGRVAPGAVWDRRWRLEGPPVPGAEVAALGAAGLALCPGWRARGLARSTLLASPAVWQGAALLAAPLARPEAEWRAFPACDPETFFTGLLSH